MSDLVGPDGTPIDIPVPDAEKPVDEHVQAMCDGFARKIGQAGDVGVSMASVLEALVQTMARVQVSRGVGLQPAVTQLLARFPAVYAYWFRALGRGFGKHERGDD